MSEAVFDRILSELQALRAGQDELRVGQDQLRVGLHEMRAAQDGLRAGQDGLEVGQNSMSVRLDMLQASHDTLRGDVMARIDRLQDSVTAMREDVAVNFARADNPARSIAQFRNEQTGTTTALRNDLEAMNEFIIAVERKVRHLSNQFHAFRQERDSGHQQPGH